MYAFTWKTFCLVLDDRPCTVLIRETMVPNGLYTFASKQVDDSKANTAKLGQDETKRLFRAS